MSPIAGRNLLGATILGTLAAFPFQASMGQELAAEPPAAYSVGAAFDSDRGVLVVFGGFFQGRYLGDTWEHDGQGWRRGTEPGPSARNGPSMVYDEKRHQIVLFGGDTRATGPLGDTWIYEKTGWRQVTTAGPPGRSGHAMVYDSRRERVVLFGGSASGAMLGDTWEWDGERWTPMAESGPPARALHGLAFDAGRGRVVLYGGTSRFAPEATPFNDTWEWDGIRWSRIDSPGPGARDHVAMSYDPGRGVTVLEGGGPAAEYASETWTYDGKRWTRLTNGGPRRVNPQLVFNPKAGVLMMYGGFDREPSNELWYLEESGWTRR